MTGAFPQRPYGSADFEPKRRKLPLYLDKRRCLIGVDDIDADRDSSHPDRQATDVRLPARSLPGDVRVPSINPHTCGRLVHETSFRRLATSFGVPGWRQRPSELQPRPIDDDMAIPGIRGGAPHLHRPLRVKLRARPWRWLRRHRPGAAPHSSTFGIRHGSAIHFRFLDPNCQQTTNGRRPRKAATRLPESCRRTLLMLIALGGFQRLAGRRSCSAPVNLDAALGD